MRMLTVARVLVLMRDGRVRARTCRALLSQGFVVEAPAPVDGLAAAAGFRPDLAIVDDHWARRGAGAIEVVRTLGGADDVAVIVVAGELDVEEKMAAFEAGADDVVIGPVDVIELVARTRAILRRSGRRVSRSWQLDDLVVDEGAHRVFRGDHELELTPTEFALLCALGRRPGRVMTKRQLLETVWGFDALNVNVVEVHVSSLRRKLEVAGPRLLLTIRGVGYVLRSADRELVMS